MKKSLVIAEKPSVGRDIARVLNCRQDRNGYIEGDKYIVSWALGHLVSLKNPEDYSKNYREWKMEDLPIIPKKMETKLIPNTKKQFFTIKKLSDRQDIKEVIIATDAGREGELVARWIIEGFSKNYPLKRLWISSVTDKAIRDGFKNLRDVRDYDNLYSAAVARSEADWIVGINGTRALTVKYNAQLSCGRVQTPTLNMVYKREEERRNFVPKDFASLKANVDGIDFQWRDRKTGNTREFNIDSMRDLEKKLKNSKPSLRDKKVKLKKSYPAKLYDLTELQKDSYRIYKYSAKETLNIMQKLYEEKKALTYPRTDSRYLTEDIVPTLKDRLKAVSGEHKAYANRLSMKSIKANKNFVDNTRVRDHHAIIPTEEFVDINELTNREKHIYNLVVRRFLEALSDPYEYEETTVSLDIGGEEFTSKFEKPLKLGYKELSDKENHLSTGGLKDLKLRNLSLTVDKTQPKPYLNEGSLIGYMENPVSFLDDSERDKAKILGEIGGIGTVATRGDIIDKLFNSFLLEKRGEDIVTTSKGRQLLQLVPEDLKSPGLTAVWEKKLEKIEDGKMSKDSFINEAKSYTREIVKDINTSSQNYVHDNLTGTRCPICNEYMLEVKTRNGKMYVCQDRNCKGRKNIYRTTNRRCPQCMKKMRLSGEGQSEKFYCQCGYTESMKEYEKLKKEKKKIPSKGEVKKYLKSQEKQDDNINSDLFDALKSLKLDK